MLSKIVNEAGRDLLSLLSIISPELQKKYRNHLEFYGMHKNSVIKDISNNDIVYDTPASSTFGL